MRQKYELTEAEWPILDIVWNYKHCTAPAVQEQLEEQTGWAYSTVKTLMDRMVAKGFLKMERSHKIGRTELVVLFVMGIFLLPMARARIDATPNDIQSLPQSTKDVSNVNRTLDTPATHILSFPMNNGTTYLSAKDPHVGQGIGLNPERVDLGDADWHVIARAQGNVTVPTNQHIRLGIDLKSRQDVLSGLSELGPSDLYELNICSTVKRRSSNQVSLEAMSHLTGLQSLSIYQTGITGQQISRLKAFSSLRALSMHEEHTFRNYDMAALKDLPALEYLDCGTGCTDKGLEHLGQLPHLRWLILRMERIRGPGLAHLANLARLERLSLWGGRISDRHVSFLRGLRHLKSLTLWGSSTSFSDATLTAISKLTTLEELYFIRTQTKFSHQGLAQLASLKHLRTLHLSQEIGDAQCLTRLPQLESIKPVSLTIHNMEALSHLPHLKSLGINLARLSKESSHKAVALLASLKSLEKLTFHGLQIDATPWSDEDMARMAGLSHLKHWVAHNLEITDKGLASISQLTSLEYLDLSNNTFNLKGRTQRESNHLTKRGLNHLNKLTNLRSLRIVEVFPQSSPVTDDPTLNLAGLHHLQDFSSAGVPFQETDLACLANLVNLEQLKLNDRLSENALRHLKGLSKLKHLYFGKITCTDGHGLAQLSGLNRLERLELTGHITDAALARLSGLPVLWAFNVTTDATIHAGTRARLKMNLPLVKAVNVK